MDETLKKLRDQIYTRVEGSLDNDEWLHHRDWLNLYIQLKTLDKMDEILESLDALWNKLDNVQDVESHG